MSSWEIRLLRSSLELGLDGMQKVLLDSGCFIYFRRIADRFEIEHRAGFESKDFSYPFLEESPWLLEECFDRGFSRIEGVDCYIEGASLYSAVDSRDNPASLLLFESVVDGVDPEAVHHAFSSLLGRGHCSTGLSGGDSWLGHYMEEVDKVGSPVLLRGEPGMDFRALVDNYCRVRLGGASVGVFDPRSLTDEVQLRELFGDNVGARLSGSGEVVPLVERGFSALFVMEAAHLSAQLQLRLLAYFSEKQVGQAWFFCTTLDLERLAEAGRFESSLVSLLKQGVVELAPLRSDLARVKYEIEAILSDVRLRYGRSVRLSASAWGAVESYGWPGNHKELRLVIFESALLSHDGWIHAESLSLGKFAQEIDGSSSSLRESLLLLERELLLESYVTHSGNQVHMAKALGISRGSLQYKMEKFGFMEGSDGK